MKKHSEPLFQKSHFSSPESNEFFELLHNTSKNISIVLRSRGVGKEILTLSALSRSCQFLPLSDRTTRGTVLPVGPS